MEKRRVVVTGMACFTPIGNGLEDFWTGLSTGKNGVGPITQFDSSNQKVHFAAEVKDFDALHFIDKKEAKRMDRFTQFGVAASIQALQDAQFVINDLNSEQVGILIGSGVGGIRIMEEQQEILLTKGPDRCSPFMVPMMISNMASGQAAIHTGAKGPNSCTVTACTAGTNAIGDAFRIIQMGHAQAMLCGGTESAVTPLSIAGFAAARALSTRNDDPEHASRPFDKDRDGFVLGEGCGILLLEELTYAQARGARIYAELVGYAMTCDAYHMTAPVPGHEGAARAMRLALKDASIAPEQLDYLSAHGTITPGNDANESMAIKTALGDHAYKVSISSTKSMTGHLLGASGGIEAIASVLAMQHDLVPPTINLDSPDELCDLDYTPKVAKARTINYAMSNSFGFGGHNGCLIFKKFVS
jgi:3-oxoacyl-[acyl-carrier-protein] synthase II